jgi:hypothetical protein
MVSELQAYDVKALHSSCLPGVPTVGVSSERGRTV